MKWKEYKQYLKEEIAFFNRNPVMYLPISLIIFDIIYLLKINLCP